MAPPKSKSKSTYSRKPGAFDRYTSSQVGSDGKKVLNLKPLRELTPPEDGVLRYSQRFRRSEDYRAN
jgi:hypothetical protein